MPLAQIFGLKAAFTFLKKLKSKSIIKKEQNLYNYAFSELARIEKIVIYNSKSVSTSIITFNLQRYHAHDVVDYLGKNNVFLRAGDFCCPNLAKLIGTSSALRISFGLYNNYADINRLIVYLKKIVNKPQVLLPF